MAVDPVIASTKEGSGSSRSGIRPGGARGRRPVARWLRAIGLVTVAAMIAALLLAVVQPVLVAITV